MSAPTVPALLTLKRTVAVVCVLIAASPVRAAEPVPVAASAPASAAAADVGRAVYQQRGADGKVLLTDRPAAGLATERRWRIDPAEDAASAAERREASRMQADRVTERIQRSIDRQQVLDNQLQIEQLRSRQAADALAAERARERDSESRPYVVLPGRPWAQPPTVPPSPRPSLPNPPHTLKPTLLPEPTLRIGKRAPGAPETDR
ncbi:MAG: hypothetical protein QFE16_11220 [Pseudomonadota bacterium]|nr:hypothetical protein [Pseudomonadota bacterium]